MVMMMMTKVYEEMICPVHVNDAHFHEFLTRWQLCLQSFP